jgi:peptidoglycan/xylan/chitin deacetylase (PgdA/CDA1 family)
MINGLPILTYHSIDDDASVISTSPKAFRRQMEFLRAESFRSISMSEVTNLLHNRKPMPARTVCLVFDDGYQNVYTEAFPILQECGFNATVFLVTRYCGNFNDWPGNLPYLKRARLLSWREVKEMDAHGFEFGAHTLTHPDLSQIPLSQAKHEIFDSKRELEERVGCPVDVFSYPYGRYNSPVKVFVRTQFRGACSTKLGNVRNDADPYAMRRIDSWFLSNQKLFSRLTTRSLAGYLQVRQAVREIKDLIGRTR